MRGFRSIKLNLIISFAVTIMVMGSITFYPLLSYRAPISEYNNVLDNISFSNNIITLANDVDLIVKDLMLETDNTEKRAEYVKAVDSLKKNFDVLGLRIKSQESKTKHNAISGLIQTYIESCDSVVSVDSSITYKMRNDNSSIAEQNLGFIDSNIKQLISSEIDYTKIVRENLDKTTRQIVLVTIIIIGLVILVCLSFAVYIARGLSNPLNLIAKTADRVALGDLTHNRIDIKSNNELGMLGKSFNKMVVNLVDMLVKVRKNSEEISNMANTLKLNVSQSSLASGIIADAINQVATGADNQAKMLESSAKTIDDMCRIVRSITDKATIARDSSNEANFVTNDGSHSVKAVIEQIGSINDTIIESSHISDELHDKSEEIGQIVEVIRSIADQTNLLSLNATIEAARAGEHGRGFAVVAGEVRKLAEQSAVSASKITNIVNEIQTQTSRMSTSMKKGIGEINTGVVVSNAAGKAFDKVNISMESINMQINDIYSEMMSMSDAIEDIKKVSEEVVTIAKQSAISSQEVAASVEEMGAGLEEVFSTSSVLNDTAEDFKSLASKFKINE